VSVLQDVFKEQLVKRRPSLQILLLKIGIVGGAALLGAAVLLIEMLIMFAPVFWVVLAFAVFFVFKRLYIEYEYALTNYDLDIDIIYGKAKRKRGFSGSVRDFEAFRKVGSPEMEHSFSSASRRMDFSGGVDGCYEFLINQHGNKLRVVFAPNEEILAAILPQLKRGIFR